MRTYCIIILWLLGLGMTYGQKEDHVWLFGKAIYDLVDEEVKADTTWGASNIDFNFSPPMIYYDSDRLWDFRATNASICDQDGDILLYTNGQSIYNGAHDRIVDTINYNEQWDNWTTVHNGVVLNEGLPTIQGAIVLPIPEESDQYYVIYQDYDLPNSYQERLLYAKLQLSSSSDDGLLEIKDALILDDSIGGGGLTAVRHGNGRDWWLMQIARNSEKMYLYLIHPNGIEFYNDQLIGDFFTYGLGQAQFSPNGRIIGLNCIYDFGLDGTKVSFMNFNRCSGEFSNHSSELLNGYGVSTGMSYSNDSRYAYVSNDSFIYQYDMQATDILDSKEKVATYDGFEYFYPPNFNFGFPVTLGWMGLGPDGRIYISAGSGSNRYMSIMDHPERAGISCEIKQHSLLMPTSYVRGIPNFPNYRLGPWDDSPCDTLGLDNIPVAKFRCDQDTINEFSFEFTDLSYYEPEEWMWTIDGQTITDQYASYVFPGTGVYTVCLEVRNGNGEDTNCKTISLGVSSTTEQAAEIPLSLFPNPVQDFLTVSLHDYFVVLASFELFDASGAKVFSKPLRSSWNTYDLSAFVAGNYFYRIVQGNEILKTGTLVKM